MTKTSGTPRFDVNQPTVHRSTTSAAYLTAIQVDTASTVRAVSGWRPGVADGRGPRDDAHAGRGRSAEGDDRSPAAGRSCRHATGAVRAARRGLARPVRRADPDRSRAADLAAVSGRRDDPRVA